MGIKGFMRWLYKNCPSCVTRSAPAVDNLYVDVNGLIYESARTVYEIRRVGRYTPPPESKLFDHVYETLLTTIEFVRPSRSVYIAMDGVAPKAKQPLQRRRRAAPLDPNYAFDFAQITAGTDFMRRLSSHVRRRFSDRVVVSDHLEPGEGEHKIIRAIEREAIGASCCIAGLDSDLVHLALLLKRPSIYLLRNFEYVDVREIARRLSMPVNDFVVMSFLVGNDFVPALIELEDFGLEIAHEIYVRLGIALTDADGINLDELKWLLSDLAPHAREGGNGDAREYLATLEWIYEYYVRGVPSWTWCYTGESAPSVADLMGCDAKRTTFALGTPPSPAEQLRAVLPKRCLQLVEDL